MTIDEIMGLAEQHIPNVREIRCDILDFARALLAAAPVAQQERIADAEVDAFAAWWGEPDERSAMVQYWAQQAWLKRAQLAAPVAQQEPTGYRLVPIHPTANQKAVGAAACPSGADIAANVYWSMVNAAPAEQGEREPDDARDAARYRELNTPEIKDFILAIEREALHQRDRWQASGDEGKSDADWFWLIGYLAGKAIHKPEKQLHHIITTAAACLNWHAARTGNYGAMRPGIAQPID